jgi:hypothetical protein
MDQGTRRAPTRRIARKYGRTSKQMEALFVRVFVHRNPK